MFERITPSFYVFLWGYFLLVSIPLCSQSPTSLVLDYNQVTCESLQEILDNIFEEDLAETKETEAIAQNLLQIATTKNCTALKDALNLCGLLQYNSNDPVAAKELLLKADTLLNNGFVNTASNVRNKLYLGLTNQIDNNFVGAKIYFEKAAQISQQIGFQKGLLQAYLNLSLGYIKEKEYTQARTLLTKASTISESIDNKLLGGYVYQNLARTYLDEKDFENALIYTKEAERVWKKLDFHKGLYFINLNFAHIAKWKGDTISLIKHLEAASVYSEKNKSFARHYVYLELGHYHFHRNHSEKAKAYYEQALQLSNSINEKDFLELISNLLNLYEKDNEIEKVRQVGKDILTIYEKKTASINKELENWARAEKSLQALQVTVRHRNYILFLLLGLIASLGAVGFIIQRASNVKTNLLNKIQVQNLELSTINKELSLQKAKVEEQKKHLQELDTMKSNFFTNISHEFRTPLTVISGMTNNIIGNEKEKGLIQRNANNLLQLINQVLDLSKLENESLKVKTVQEDIVKYVRYICESFHSYANDKNILLQVTAGQLELIMDYDPNKIQQIISNLLSNAIKHSPSGGKVLIHVDKLTQPNEQAYFQLSVSDTGPGIADTDLEKIFNRFYQADDEASKAGGTGIGLALVKELVELMEGSVQVKSEVGIGSQFIIQLPITNKTKLNTDNVPLVNPPIALTHPKPHSTHTTSDKPLLLVMEDNADVVEYLTSCLEKDYQLEYAYNGRVGIEKAIELVPDIIISDVMMPEKSGFEVCNTLKQSQVTSHIPIILLTARATIKDKISGLAYGADAYLSKPFDPEELLVRISQLIENRKRIQAKYSKVELIAQPTPKTEDTFLQKIQQIILAHLAEETFGSNELIQLLGTSRTQLHRKLKALTGISTANYIRKIRLQEAKKLLLSKEATISEVGYAVGYTTLAHFSASFSKEFNCSPTAFREQHLPKI